MCQTFQNGLCSLFLGFAFYAFVSQTPIFGSCSCSLYASSLGNWILGFYQHCSESRSGGAPESSSQPAGAPHSTPRKPRTVGAVLSSVSGAPLLRPCIY